MKKNIKTKQIAFNLDDPMQKKLFEHACKNKNFSFYGKTLIQKDMEGWVRNGNSNEVYDDKDEPEISDDIVSSLI